MLNKIKLSTPLQILFLCLAGFSAWYITLFFHPDVPASSDAAIYASLARNITQGHGFNLPATLPAFVDSSLITSDFGWPPFVAPFFSILVSIFFFVFGVKEFSIAATNGFLFIITIPFFYLIALKLFNQRTAILACVWYIFNPLILYRSIWGEPKMLIIFLVVLGYYLFFVFRKTFLTGLVFGIVSLAKLQGGLVVIPLAIYLLFFNAKKTFLPFVAGVAIIILLNSFLSPKLSVSIVGANNDLWASIAYEALYPSVNLGRNFETYTLSMLLNNVPAIIIKFAHNSYVFWRDIFFGSLAPIIVLYILSFFKIEKKKDAQVLKYLSISSIFIFLLFYLMTYFNHRYLYANLPLVILFAASTFLSIMEKFNPKKIFLSASIFTVFFIVIPSTVSPLWGTNECLVQNFRKADKPSMGQLIGRFILENTNKDDVIITNDFTSVAWFGERKAVFIPLRIKDISTIKKYIPASHFLLLIKNANLTSCNYWVLPLEKEWVNLNETTRYPDKFTLVKKTNISPEENYHNIETELLLYRID